MKPSVHIENLSVSFFGRRALDHVNADFPASNISVLVGRSGSGKTTLLRTINRLNEEFPGCVTSGRVSIDFGSISHSLYPSPRDADPPQGAPLPLPELRRRVGMLFQTPTLFPASIYRNLSMPLSLVAGCKEKELPEKIRASLEAVGLWDELSARLDMPADRLSGGQQQRLCLARTLALEPAVLLLDEPTASLDVHASRDIEDLLLQLSDRHTIIMVSHSLVQARRMGSRILVCDSGRVTRTLSAAEALSEETLAGLL